MKLLYVDLFCGAGGTSTGVNSAMVNGEQCADVVACVNHDANAIASHASNHPESLHFTEDIRTLELSPLIAHLEQCRRNNPDSYVVLWASLECTNFSKAKGGKPRNGDSRTLAEHLFRYVEAINPDYIQIENVEEFMGWGDIDENGKPISKDKGKSYHRWVENIKQYGYEYDYRILNSADYGAYTARKRFFGIFAKQGLPIVFPRPTHFKNPEKSLFDSPLKWKPVRNVLDLEDRGTSIFSRKKELSDKTLERIYAGLVKFVAGGKDKWILKYNSINGKTRKHTPPSIDEPCHTVSCQGRLGLLSVDRSTSFLSKQYSGHPASKNVSIDEPTGAITCIDHHAFVSAYYGNGHNHALSKPCPTVTCRDRFSLITPKSYLMNPQYSSAGGSIDKPCFTLIARMDKMPPYIVNPIQGNPNILIKEDDNEIMVKIKEFMRAYYISDITMRMLKIIELKKIMGFPFDYTLIGTQADQKKFIGNAVEVNTARVLCEALYNALKKLKQVA